MGFLNTVKKYFSINRYDKEFYSIFQYHNAPMLLIDPKSYKIIDSNIAAQNFYNYTKQELRSMKIRDINILPEHEIIKEKINAEYENRNYFIFPHRLKNGEIRIVEVHSSPVTINNKELLFSIIHDVTKRKEIEQNLKTNETNFSTFIESITDLIIIGTPDGKIYFTNSAVEKKLGYSKQELKEMHILDLHPPEYRQEAEKIFHQMFNNEKEVCPLPLIKKDNTLLLVETRIWFSQWNNTNCIFGISKDLTLEQEAQQKFERIFRNNPSPMAISTLSSIFVSKFVDINDSFIKTLGYSKEEIINKSSSELNLFVNTNNYFQALNQLEKYQKISNIELQAKCKNNSILTGLFSGEVITSQGKQYFLTVMSNITDLKNLEIKQQDLIIKLQKTLEEVKTLQGFIPICAGCKKIRNDQGYWEQIEKYIQDRTGAQFSHGMCPKCIKEFYPDIYPQMFDK